MIYTKSVRSLKKNERKLRRRLNLSLLILGVLITNSLTMSYEALNRLSDEEYSKFYESIRWLIPIEGGYVNDPEDPGGETKWGIAKRFHPDVDIENLTPEEATWIYYTEYWKPSGAGQLPFPLCLVVFDTAVLCGVSRAKQFLRESGSNISQYLDARRQHHIARSKRKHVNGHLRRVSLLQKLVEEYQ
jgi:hypothetical protein